MIKSFPLSIKNPYFSVVSNFILGKPKAHELKDDGSYTSDRAKPLDIRVLRAMVGTSLVKYGIASPE
ncbi:MAG TPA: hypothetical protein C5S50_10145 [Methanosarcinaceae archaeon]|nr:hypothetical protein [Methanosarcinaceae archaeon]